MLFSYLTSTSSASDEGDIQDIWGYKFRWTELHLTEEQISPTRYTYDTLGEEVLDRIHAQQKLKSGSNGISASQAAGHKEDLYESLKEAALSKEDDVLTKFWNDIHTVPEWVDWEQIKRGQDVFYLYGEAALTGLTFSSLLGGMGAARIVETLARTGGFAPKVARKRMLETVQHTLQCTDSLESIQPGGDGHIACLRVRLLHAAVRKKIMTLAKTRPQYYDVKTFGIPINDQDTISTIGTFSGQLIWIALPAQGIFMKRHEIVDYLALWRLVAYYMGTPTDPLDTVEGTKAYMESILKLELVPSPSSQVLAGNIISSLANQAPRYASADYLCAMARWLNGPGLSDALDIPKSSFLTNALVAVQILVLGVSTYVIREIPVLQKRKINALRKKFHNDFILGKGGLNGKMTKFELQYVPGYDTATEKGVATRGLALGNFASADSHSFILLLTLLGMGFGSVYFGTSMLFWFWGGSLRWFTRGIM